MATLSDGRSAVIGHPSLLSCDWAHDANLATRRPLVDLRGRVVGFAGERAPVREP